MKQTKSTVAHTVFTALFLVLAIVSFLGLMIFDIEMLSIMAEPPADGSDGFGQGLGLAISAVFAVIFAVATGVISLIGIIISATAVKARLGGAKIFAAVALVLEIIFLVLSVTSVIFVSVGL